MIDFLGLQIESYSREEGLLQKIKEMSDEMSIYERDNTYFIKALKNNNIVNFSMFTNKKINGIHELIGIRYRKLEFTNYIMPQALGHVVEELYLADNKDIKEKLSIILCKDSTCPICSTKMLVSESEHYSKCSNLCYKVYSIPEVDMVFKAGIFSEEYNYSLIGYPSLESKVGNINDIYKEINYWRENDRYLMKIMKGEA